MENNKSPLRDWKGMDYELLMRIFMTLSAVDFASVSEVCSFWRKVCEDPIFWDGRVLDLSNLSPHISQSNSRKILFMKYVLYLSRGKIGCLIFNFFLPLNDGILINVAKRSRNLKRLVLPCIIQLTKMGIDQATQLWDGLESLTMTDNSTACAFLEAIGKYCKNFSELKLTCPLTLKIAKALTKHVPKLKILSLQSIRVNKDAMVRVVKHLQDLEVLNVSHSFIVKATHPQITVYQQHQVPSILRNIPRIPNLIKCEDNCIMCQEVLVWNLNNEWRNPKEQIWRNDEIYSLRV